jgi:GDPmannose 4,6-dehydratase
MKKVLITGILGQDGANMAEYLLSLDDDMEVCGMMRRTSNVNKSNIEAFESHSNFKLVYGDLTDDVSIDKVVRETPT